MSVATAPALARVEDSGASILDPRSLDRPTASRVRLRAHAHSDVEAILVQQRLEESLCGYIT